MSDAFSALDRAKELMKSPMLRRRAFGRIQNGDNKLRIVEVDKLAFLRADFHAGTNEDGKFSFAAALAILASPEFRQLYGKTDIEGTPELELIEQFGDPVTVLRGKAREKGVYSKATAEEAGLTWRNRPWGSLRGFMTVVGDGGGWSIFELPPSASDRIERIQSLYPDVFDPVEGQPILVTYDKDAAPTNKYAIDVLPPDGGVTLVGEQPDLTSEVARKFMPWRDKVAFTLRSYPDWVAFAGLEPADVGVRSF
jgi:hypothetical protein